MKTIVLVLCLVLTGAVSHAAETTFPPRTARQFLLICESMEKIEGLQPNDPTNVLKDGINMGFCTGYINGFLDSVPLMQEAAQKQKICLPAAGLSTGNVLMVFRRHLSNFPQLMNESVRATLYSSLATGYPCQGVSR
jgi:hypothetical protein